MIKMQIKLNDNKIEQGGRYSLERIYAALDDYLVSQLHFEKSGDGFYLGTGLPDDFGNFGLAMVTLGKKPWFMDNVETWLYFNSEDSDDPNDFAVEDFKEFCQAHYQAAA
jgi:hypothetical protein